MTTNASYVANGLDTSKFIFMGTLAGLEYLKWQAALIDWIECGIMCESRLVTSGGQTKYRSSVFKYG